MWFFLQHSSTQLHSGRTCAKIRNTGTPIDLQHLIHVWMPPHTHTCSCHINTIKNHFTTRSLTEHYFAAMPINHPRAVSHSSNISIMVHHLRLGEMKVIHSKMNHSCPACHMLFRVRRRLYCRFLGHLSSACIFEVLQRRLVYLK